MNDSSLVNLTEIDIHESYKFMNNTDFVKFRESITWIDVMYETFWDKYLEITKFIFERPQVQEMIKPNSNVTFDLIITEALISFGIYGLAHRFDAPIIGVSTLGYWNFNYYYWGSSVLPSHPSSFEMGDCTGFDLPFWQRLQNFIRLWSFIYYTSEHIYPKHQKLAEEFLGPGVPDLRDLERNLSIVLNVEDNFASFVRPIPAKEIRIGPLHIRHNWLKPLPDDLRCFLDESTSGFIYISFGTSSKIESFGEEARQALVNVIEKLPYRIVLKLQVKTLLNRIPKNVFVSKWFPQQTLLDHPNVKLFIYQGGQQSTSETLHYGVPVIGIPILADQDRNVKRLVNLGMGRHIRYSDLTFETLNESIFHVWHDERYAKRAKEMRKLMRDKPFNGTNLAIRWIEHVMRYKGAPFLQSSLSYEPWYQRNDIDVVAFISVSLLVLASSILLITRKIILHVRKSKPWRKEKFA
ncbi:UDP-glycosyltransferase UGT5-like [Prorops nasuta]|uniref:UDP-glycosyltransferase UGT5-like n=1 Tax=Prorops nasuta TaxID=863751 RepID=UPI0034CE8310